MPETSPHAVIAEHLVASYGDGARRVPVLDRASFTIDRGGFAVLMGPSGSGKTTLLSLLGALDVAEEGVLRVCGQELTRMGRRARARFRREQVGFVFQSFHLLATLTVQENVEVGLEPLGLGRGPRRARAEEALDRVGLLALGNRFPHALSGGQQQRVAVARACAKSPALLLADEPTGNLDEEAGAQVLDLIAETASGARTVVVVTHDPAVAARADAVYAVRGHGVVRT